MWQGYPGDGKVPLTWEDAGVKTGRYSYLLVLKPVSAALGRSPYPLRREASSRGSRKAEHGSDCQGLPPGRQTRCLRLLICGSGLGTFCDVRIWSRRTAVVLQRE